MEDISARLSSRTLDVSALEDKIGVMQNTPTEKLLAEVNDFLAETGMKKSYFGKAASGNSELVSRLQGGGRVWPETADKIRAFMAKRRQSADKRGAAQ